MLSAGAELAVLDEVASMMTSGASEGDAPEINSLSDLQPLPENVNVFRIGAFERFIN